MNAARKLTVRSAVVAFVGLIMLAAVSLALSFVSLGAWELPLALAIAVVKAAWVVVVFMHLWEQPESHGLVALVAVIFIVILVSLVVSDVVTRVTPHQRL